MKLIIDGWTDGSPIPSRYAFGKVPAEGRFEFGGNISPALAWSDAPEGTKSFAIICHDPDVPSRPDDVNQEGKTVSASLPRVDFFHWVVVDIPAEATSIAEGAASGGVTARGKTTGQKPYGVAGKNNYTEWFAGDPDMGGVYGDYDGPCPPWNDEIVHHYHFTLYALDIESLCFRDGFSGTEALAAMNDHVLASSRFIGTYTMNRDLTT